MLQPMMFILACSCRGNLAEMMLWTRALVDQEVVELYFFPLNRVVQSRSGELVVAEIVWYFNYNLDIPITVKRHYTYSLDFPIAAKRHFTNSLDVAISGRRHFSFSTDFEVDDTPPGVVYPFAGPVANIPVGYLLCDGASLLRASYPALFSAIGIIYGAADGTHFNLPD